MGGRSRFPDRRVGEGFLSVHLSSRVGLARSCEAFCADDSGKEEEEEGEIELKLGEVVVVQVPARWARNDLLTSPSWSPSRIRPQKNEPIRPSLLLPVLEPRVLPGEDFLVRPVGALVLSDDETHVQQTRP